MNSEVNGNSNNDNKRAGAAQFVAAFAGDLLLLAFALVAVVASFRATPAEAYYFPQLMSVLLLLFAAINAAKNFRFGTTPPVSAALCRRLLPGVLIAFVYIYVCDIIGFYWSALVAFPLMSAVYMDAPLTRRRAVILVLATALVFGFVWLLFDVLLRVQTPEPFWVD